MIQLKPSQLLSATALVAALAMPLHASAGDPQASYYVDSASVVVDPVHDIVDRTAWVGIEECETLIDNERDVDARFTTLVDLEVEGVFGGLFHYHLQRDEDPISCLRSDPEGGGDEMHEACSDVDEDYISLDEDPNTGRLEEISVAMPFETLTGLDIDDCTGGQIDRNYYIQLRLREDPQDDADWERSEVRVVVDLIRPEPPRLTDAFVTANTIRVEFESSDSEDAVDHAVVYSTESFQQGDRAEEVMEDAPAVIPGDQEGQVDVDLEQGETVFVGMVARDEAGNLSYTADPLETTVVETDGFWDFYVGADGQDQGGYGCGAAPGSPGNPLVWFAVVAMSMFLARLFATGRHVRNHARISVSTRKDASR